MSKYVFINVQGVSDVSTRIFDNCESVEEYVKDFFDEDEDDYSYEDLLPYGEIRMYDQTLIVLEVEV
jgi:hypothetical protein